MIRQPTVNLAILGSSLTGLAVARVAHRSGLRCVIVDDRQGPAADTRCARFVKAPAEDLESVLSSIAPATVDGDRYVVADSDRWLRFVMQHRARLEQAGWKVLHPSSDTIGVCLDKSRFLDWCVSHHIPAPARYDVSSPALAAQVKFPVIVRPEWTQHSSGVVLPKALEVNDSEQLAHWLARYRELGVKANVSESLLRPGLRQFSVGAARNAAGEALTFLAEKVRPAPEQCAGGTFVRPAQQDGIEAVARSALETLEFFGVAEVEVLFDPATARAAIVEVNARPWLQFGLPARCGVDLLGHALGKEGQRNTGPRNEKHAWLYFESDLYACFAREGGIVRDGRVPLWSYIRSLLSSRVFAVWDVRDPMPMVFMTVRKLVRRVRLRA